MRSLSDSVYITRKYQATKLFSDFSKQGGLYQIAEMAEADFD
jgi:hypothetical protein